MLINKPIRILSTHHLYTNIYHSPVCLHEPLHSTYIYTCILYTHTHTHRRTAILLNLGTTSNNPTDIRRLGAC